MRRSEQLANCDHRRWLRDVRAAADLDALAATRGERNRHVVLRAYLDDWRCRAGEFFGAGLQPG